MKLYPLSVVVFCLMLALAGCSSEPATPPAPRPLVGILNVEKLGNGPRETSQYDILLHYSHVEPDKYEIKIGFGYNPSAAAARALGNPSRGVYAIAHSEVVHSSSGEIRVTVEPSTVRNLRATMDGKIYAIISKYPHGKEWIIAGLGVFELPSP